MVRTRCPKQYRYTADVICRPLVFDYVRNIISNAGLYSPLLVERAVVGLLRLASSLAEHVRIFNTDENEPAD